MRITKLKNGYRIKLTDLEYDALRQAAGNGSNGVDAQDLGITGRGGVCAYNRIALWAFNGAVDENRRGDLSNMAI